MLAGSIDNITEADLQVLIENGEQESQTLDFKRDLPGKDERSKLEFCADVCAMANASGGDLVFGIDEDGEGNAATLIPFDSNPDQAQLRLLQLVESGVEPRIPGLRARAVSVDEGSVLVVRVPKSGSAPHWVKASQRFVVREGARKRPLDIPEIRSAFLRSEGQAEKMRNFRADRIGKILAAETPVPLHHGPVGVLHIVPAQLGLPNTNVDPLCYQLGQSLPLIPKGCATSGVRINLDGALRSAFLGDSDNIGYTLFFRNGQFESTRVFVERDEQGECIIPGLLYEEELIWLYDCISVEMKRLQLGPPFVIFYTLLGVKTAHIRGKSWNPVMTQFLQDERGRFDRRDIWIPETVVETDQTGNAALKPIFDLVWQSTGFAQSPNYDGDGNWNPR